MPLQGTYEPGSSAWVRKQAERDEATGGGRDDLARKVSGEEETTWWARAVETWPDYAIYQTKTDREIPVFVLEPLEP